MKLSKSAMVTALAAGSLFATVELPAQDTTNPPPAGRPLVRPRGIEAGSSVDQLAARLKLDDAAKAKVKTIIEGQDKKVADWRADAALSPADRRAKYQALLKDTTAKMKAVLTPDQFDQWQKMTEPRRRRALPPAAPK
jgi:hypothetical protein